MDGAPTLEPRGLPFEYQGPPEAAAALLAALEQVVDPEMALDIVNLGLVRAVRLSGERALVELTMTSAACPVTELIVEDVHAALAGALPAGCSSDVRLVWDPPWSPECMSPRARAAMGWP